MNYSPYEPCKIDTIAPHIHVLTRDIPFILNINAWVTSNPPYETGFINAGEISCAAY